MGETGSEFSNLPSKELKPNIQQNQDIMKMTFLQRLRQRFQQLFPKEQNPELPEMSVNIFYSLHGTAKDFEGLKKEFEEADIYIPERPGWKRHHLWRLRALSIGDLIPYKPSGKNSEQQKDALWETDNIVYNSHKPITFIDIPSNHTLVKRWNKNLAEFQFGSNFNDALDAERRYIAENVAIIKERERYMVDQLEPRIQKLLKDYPDLLKKQHINILLSLGLAHTFLYHNLKRDYRTTRVMSKMPAVFSFEDEAMRRLMFDKQAGDELVARVAMEQCLWKVYHDSLYALTFDSEKIVRAFRKLNVQFSFDEIKNMIEGAKSISSWKSLFEEGLLQKGLRMPTSEKELDEFLAKPLPLRPNSQVSKQ